MLKIKNNIIDFEEDAKYNAENQTGKWNVTLNGKKACTLVATGNLMLENTTEEVNLDLTRDILLAFKDLNLDNAKEDGLIYEESNNSIKIFFEDEEVGIIDNENNLTIYDFDALGYFLNLMSSYSNVDFEEDEKVLTINDLNNLLDIAPRGDFAYSRLTNLINFEDSGKISLKATNLTKEKFKAIWREEYSKAKKDFRHLKRDSYKLIYRDYLRAYRIILKFYK